MSKTETLKMIDYAMEGIRSEMAGIGLQFTERGLDVKRAGELVSRTGELYSDLLALNYRREKIMQGAE